jgi:hypothetical protein
MANEPAPAPPDEHDEDNDPGLPAWSLPADAAGRIAIGVE